MSNIYTVCKVFDFGEKTLSRIASFTNEDDAKAFLEYYKPLNKGAIGTFYSYITCDYIILEEPLYNKLDNFIQNSLYLFKGYVKDSKVVSCEQEFVFSRLIKHKDNSEGVVTYEHKGSYLYAHVWAKDMEDALMYFTGSNYVS